MRLEVQRLGEGAHDALRQIRHRGEIGLPGGAKIGLALRPDIVGKAEGQCVRVTHARRRGKWSGVEALLQVRRRIDAARFCQRLDAGPEIAIRVAGVRRGSAMLHLRRQIEESASLGAELCDDVGRNTMAGNRQEAGFSADAIEFVGEALTGLPGCGLEGSKIEDGEIGNGCSGHAA